MHRVLPSLLLIYLTSRLGAAQPAPAQGPLQPAHLNGMPNVQQVLQSVRGGNARETAVKQVAAFRQLREMIEKASGGRVYGNELTPDEQRLMTAYAKAIADIAGPIERSLSQQERRDWFAARSRLETSDDYRDELLKQFFTAEWSDWYLETTISADQARRRKLDRTMGKGFSSTKFELVPSIRRTIYMHLAVVIPLLALAWRRETRRFGFDQEKPDLVLAGFGDYPLRTLTGIVSDVQETTTITKTASYDTDGKLVSVGEYKTTTRFGVLRSVDSSGESHELTDLGRLGLDEGHVASVALLTRLGKDRRVLLVNHMNQSWYRSDENVRRALKPWLWPVLPLTWGVLLVIRLTAYGETWVAPALELTALVGYFVWRSRVTKRRVERFFNDATGPLIDRTRRRADELVEELDDMMRS